MRLWYLGSLIALLLLHPILSFAQESAPVSPKAPWGDFEVVEEEDGLDTWEIILLWPVNRILDLVDTVKFDAGVGLGRGGVVRFTKWGQAGYRDSDPGMLRLGNFGRRPPALIERSKEKGMGEDFRQSKERDVCDGEIGLGLDAFVVGAYAGICLDELVDFGLGLFFLDPMDDDYR